jgi:hypothetical protein
MVMAAKMHINRVAAQLQLTLSSCPYPAALARPYPSPAQG